MMLCKHCGIVALCEYLPFGTSCLILYFHSFYSWFILSLTRVFFMILCGKYSIVGSADTQKTISLLLSRHIGSLSVALFRRSVTEHRLSVHRVGKGLLCFFVSVWCHLIKCIWAPELVTRGEELLLQLRLGRLIVRHDHPLRIIGRMSFARLIPWILFGIRLGCDDFSLV